MIIFEVQILCNKLMKTIILISADTDIIEIEGRHIYFSAKVDQKILQN